MNKQVETQIPRAMRDAVLQELSRITGSPQFHRSERLQKLLEFLVTETLSGRGSSLNQQIIGTKHFRISDFDPDENTLVRSHARRLRRALVSHYAEDCAPVPLRIVMMPGDYMPRFIVSESWTGPSTRQPVQSKDSALPVLAIFEVQGRNLDGMWENLPSMLAEALCIELGVEKSLRIFGPITLPQIRDKAVSTLTIARQYGADLILEGGLEKSSSNLILRLLLRETKYSEILWTRCITFHETERSLAVESIITRSLLNEIAKDHGIISTYVCDRASTKEPSSLSIHEAMLLARAFLRTFSESAYHQGKAALDATLRDDPDCASLHAAMAWLLFGGYCEPFSWADKFPVEVRTAAENAYRLDPGNPWGKAAMCMFPLLVKDYATLAQRGIALAKASDFPPLVGGVVGCLLIYGRVHLVPAMRLIKAAMEQNPHHPSFLNFPLALDCLIKKNWKRMEHYADKYHLPDDWGYRLVKALAVLGAGRIEEGALHWQALLGVFPRFDQIGLDHLRRFLHEDYVQAAAEVLHDAKLICPKIPPSVSRPRIPNRRSRRSDRMVLNPPI